MWATSDNIQPEVDIEVDIKTKQHTDRGDARMKCEEFVKTKKKIETKIDLCMFN